MSEIIGVLQAAQEIFFKFVDEIQQNKLGQIAIRRALKKYDVKNLKINNVTSLRAKKMFATITPKYLNGLTSDKSWLENERRLFIWCTLCYLHKNSMQINDMVQILQLKKTANFQFLRSIFPLKQLDLIKFQVYSLVKKDNKNSGWKPQQDDLLRKLIKKQQLNTIQWSAIAKQFFSQSCQKYFRNAKQCRQRWLNYLDPKKEKGKWEAEQDKILLKEVLQKGKKWSKIVEALGGKKNEHMIKNRYKSLIHKKEKACKSSKINQNELIKMILKDYNQQIKQNSHLNQQDQEDVQNESSVQESFQQQQAQIQKNNLKTSITQKPRPIIKQKNEPSKPANFLKRWKATWPIIVQATHPQINPQQNVSKNDQAVKQSPLLINEVEICGDKAGKQLISNLFFSVNNSTQDNRIQPIFESRSPASNVFLASPYPAACWTPSLFFMEDSQIAASPLGGFGDFTAKTRSFTNFIADNQKRS